jgi:Glycosyltransferase family 87
MPDSSAFRTSLRSGPRAADGHGVRRFAGAVACILIGVGFLVAATYVHAPTPEVETAGTRGPVTTTRNEPKNFPGVRGSTEATDRDVRIRFAFRADAIQPFANLFQTSVGNAGIRAEFSDGPVGDRSLALIQTLTDGRLFVATLVDRPRVGRTYRVVIRVEQSRQVTAWVNGRERFDYRVGPAAARPHLDQLSVGTGFNRSRPFAGTVSGFELQYRTFSNVQPVAVTRRVLQLLGWLLVSVGILFALFRAVSGSTVLSRFVDDEPAETKAVVRPRVRRRWSARRRVALGLLLVVVGVTGLQLATPAQNVDLQRASQRSIGPITTSNGAPTEYDFGTESTFLADADALSARYRFDLRLGKPPPVDRASSIVMSTMAGNQGLSITVDRTGKLFAQIGARDLPGPVFVELERIPRGRWTRIDAEVTRDRSYAFRVDGTLIRSFTYFRRMLNPTPGNLIVGGDNGRGFGGEVRSLDASFTTYRYASPTHAGLVRAAQIGSALAVALGVAVLAAQLLGSFVPTGSGVRRPLVVVVFGVCGIFVLANLLVGFLHFQTPPYPYFARNTWLPLPDNRFSDFFEARTYMRSMSPYVGQHGNYPPFGYLVVAPIAWLGEFAALWVLLSSFIGFMAWWAWRSFTGGLRSVERVVVVAIVLASYPVTFAINRANADLIVFAILAVGFASVATKPVRAGVAVGLATAAKIIPGLYALMFLRPKSRRALWAAVLTAVAVTTVGLFVFRGGPVQNLSGFATATSTVNQANTDGVQSIPSNTSLAGWGQSIGYVVNGAEGAKAVRDAIEPFLLPLLLAGTAVLAWWLARREREPWRALTVVTAAFLLLPDVSYDYRLLFLFVPLAAFVRDAPVTRATLALSVLFGLLLGPRVFFYIGDWLIGCSVLTTAPLVAALGIVAIRSGVKPKRPPTPAPSPVRVRVGTRVPEPVDSGVSRV